MDDPPQPRPPEPTLRLLAETYLRGAAVFERTAALAEQHANRAERRGHGDVAMRERRQAARAHAAALRYREHARRLDPGLQDR